MPKTLAPEHLRFAVLATDTALFTIRKGILCVRLTRVERPPHFVHAKGLPGGLINPSETAEETASRQLLEKARIKPAKVYTEQLYTFSAIDRDPRGRVVAVAYLALVPWEELSAEEQHDTEEAWWAPVTEAKRLAYDHDEMLALARARLASRATYSTLVAKIMPSEFTLTELEHAYECVTGKDLDKRNFRKKLLKLKILKALPRKRTGGRFRPAQLYAFASKKVAAIEIL